MGDKYPLVYHGKDLVHGLLEGPRRMSHKGLELGLFSSLVPTHQREDQGRKPMIQQRFKMCMTRTRTLWHVTRQDKESVVIRTRAGYGFPRIIRPRI